MKPLLFFLIIVLLSHAEEIGENRCDNFSKAAEELFSILINDGYELENFESPLIFYKQFRNDDTLVITNVSTTGAKGKTPLKNMKGNWYPSFNISEICFPDTVSAAEYCSKIEKIINASDIRNEKYYDYIIQNGDRLIYVCAYAKIWEEYAFSYRERIETLISAYSK